MLERTRLGCPAILALVLQVVAARAEEAPSGVPVITVRPSGWEDEGAAAREHQERLRRRMEQRDLAFRAICIHCGSAPKAAASTRPFRPIDTLNARSIDPRP
jgi:hypothetical protein